MKKFLYTILFLLGFLFFDEASASVIYDVEQLDYNLGFSRSYYSQSFIPTSNKISGVIFQENSQGGLSNTYDLYLCEGKNENYNDAISCINNPISAILNQDFLVGYNTALFNNTINITSGDDYSFVIYVSEVTNSIKAYWNSDIYSDGVGFGFNVGNTDFFYNSGDLDLVFKTFYDTTLITEEFENVEIIDIPDWTGTISVESEDLLWENPKICLIDKECDWRIFYDKSRIGHSIDVYLDDENKFDYSTSSPYILESFDLIDRTMLFHDIVLSDSPYATTTESIAEYCFFEWDENEILVSIYCGNEVNWQEAMTDEEWNNYFNTDYCDCDNIATSSSDGFIEEWADAISWGGQCAFRKTVCFAFVPTEESINDIKQDMIKMTNTFPLNIYKQIENTIAGADIGATTTQILSINFGSLMGIEEFDEDIPLAEQDAMLSTFGEFWVKLYSLMEYTVYFFGFMYLFYRILIIFKRQV